MVDDDSSSGFDPASSRLVDLSLRAVDRDSAQPEPRRRFRRHTVGPRQLIAAAGAPVSGAHAVEDLLGSPR